MNYCPHCGRELNGRHILTWGKIECCRECLATTIVASTIARNDEAFKPKGFTWTWTTAITGHGYHGAKLVA